mgnify:CR=1 FL=1
MLTSTGLFAPVPGCAAKHDIHSRRRSWLSISILFLSVYSTLFSGIYLVLAIVQPRYGRAIHSGGKLTPETASILFALFAKTIEQCFPWFGQIITYEIVPRVFESSSKKGQVRLTGDACR